MDGATTRMQVGGCAAEATFPDSEPRATAEAALVSVFSCHAASPIAGRKVLLLGKYEGAPRDQAGRARACPLPALLIFS
jgi:hypothetical protein